MPRDLQPDDALQGPPTIGRMLGRGAWRRCPRCGSGDLFRTYWTIRDRCPRCGLLFAREPGYFTGVYLLNLTAVLVALFVEVMAYTLLRANDVEPSVVPFLVAGAVLAVVLPIALYPVARTLWSAIDLAMIPMELDEILDAAEASDEADAPAPAAPGDDGPTPDDQG